MDFIQTQLIDPVNKVLWTYVLVYLLVGAGIYFTIRTRFVQIRYFRRMIGQLFNSRVGDGGISSFQAFCVGLASRVGTGNIAGVATAIAAIVSSGRAPGASQSATSEAPGSPPSARQSVLAIASAPCWRA